MGLIGAILDFATGTYTVTRRGPTVPDGNGRARQAAPTTFTIVACVQPASGRDLQRLPEGLRQQGMKKLYTATRLQVIGAPDVVTVDGSDYQVEHVEDFVGFGSDYYKVIIRKVGN